MLLMLDMYDANKRIKCWQLITEIRYMYTRLRLYFPIDMVW